MFLLLYLVYCVIVYKTEHGNATRIYVPKPLTEVRNNGQTIWKHTSNSFHQNKKTEKISIDDNANPGLMKTDVKSEKLPRLSDSLGGKHYIKELYLRNISVVNANDCQNKKFLVFTCDKSMCGGWGDRLKGIVSTFLLALLTDRVFIIDITKPCELEQFLDSHKYKWSICKKYIRFDASVTSEDGTVYSTSASAYFNQFKKHDNDAKWESKVIVIRANAYLINALRQYKPSYEKLRWFLNKPNEEIIQQIVHTLFKPSLNLSKDIDNFATEHFKNKHTVCSHIRQGKNPSNPNDSALPKGTPNTTTVLSFLSRFNESDKYVIYIASDSENVKSVARKMFTNFVGANRTIIHIDRPDTKRRTKEEICAGFNFLLFEQYLLSSCDTLVLTRSNFGAMAAYIRGRSENLFLFQNSTNSVINTTVSNIQNVYKFV